MDLQAKLESLQDDIAFLSLEEFDKDVFMIKRNTIIGTSMANMLKPDEFIKWEGAFSLEPYPQHWTFYFLEGLKAQYPQEYGKVAQLFNLTIDNTRNNQESCVYPDYDSKEMFYFLLGLFPKVFKTRVARNSVGLMIHQEMTQMTNERKKKMLQIGAKIAMITDKLKDS